MNDSYLPGQTLTIWVGDEDENVLVEVGSVQILDPLATADVQAMVEQIERKTPYDYQVELKTSSGAKYTPKNVTVTVSDEGRIDPDSMVLELADDRILLATKYPVSDAGPVNIKFDFDGVVAEVDVTVSLESKVIDDIALIKPITVSSDPSGLPLIPKAIVGKTNHLVFELTAAQNRVLAADVEIHLPGQDTERFTLSFPIGQTKLIHSYAVGADVNTENEIEVKIGGLRPMVRHTSIPIDNELPT